MNTGRLPDTKNWKLELSEKILVATNNRPDVRNAMDETTWDELACFVEYADKSGDVYALIITGGETLFASGADIKSMNKRSALAVLENSGQETLCRIEQLTKPVIAAVGGYALGGACELAMACDIRIASDKAKFGQPEVNLGLIPGAGGTQRLCRLVGYGRAKELIFTGGIIDAQEAFRIGLVNKLVPSGGVVNAAFEMARTILAKGPLAIQLAKLAINAGMDTDIRTGLMVEKLSQAVLFSTEDRLEGTRAFIEKRPAEFKRK
ncbi:MAG: enoyl-CoA hydratase/isomerase family protein [Spirochaetaceae bacterium]|jgi:enoyl-CoA hydratase|nr:enoyl-CoA hydratase/isomerase family protein [Spirochaetaceae bacterium]